MSRSIHIALAWVLAAAVAGDARAQGATSSFFATRVVEYSPGEGNALFPDPSAALGGPRGTFLGSLHVVSLGVQGEMVLGFDAGRALTDAGPELPDLIVFENPIMAGPGVFAELVRVGVSTNGVDYAFFPTACSVPGPVGPYGTIDPSLVDGFAGVGPVYANVGPPADGGNDLDPFDPGEAGGDAFDLADLAGHPLVTSGAVNLHRIYYVKLVDVLGDGTEQDSAGSPIYDATGYMDPPYSQPVSADIDAISVIHGLPAAHNGDATRDGKVDGADYTLWADHFEMAGMTWDQGDFTGNGIVDGEDYTLWADNYGYNAGGASVPSPPALLLLWVGGVCLVGRRR